MRAEFPSGMGTSPPQFHNRGPRGRGNMRQQKRFVRRLARACGLACALSFGAAARARTPVDPSFTYQGQLRQGGVAINGPCDFVFTLWDADTLGAQIGPQLVLNNAVLVRGLLTADLDFGPGSINGDARWIQISVRTPSGSGPYSTLTPRQP